MEDNKAREVRIRSLEQVGEAAELPFVELHNFTSLSLHHFQEIRVLENRRGAQKLRLARVLCDLEKRILS